MAQVTKFENETYLIDGNVSNNQFSNNYTFVSIIISNCLTIGSSAFYNCFNLKTAKINDNISSIGSSAFYNCSNLT